MAKHRRPKSDGDGAPNPNLPVVGTELKQKSNKNLTEVEESTGAMAPGALLQDVDMVDVVVGRSRDGDNNGATAAGRPVGMQIYWDLSSLDMAVREAAAVALVQELVVAQKSFVENGGQGGGAAEVLGAKGNTDVYFEGCAPSVQYALRRLVRGLGSSRESARQGFAAAFAAVVGALPVLRGMSLLRVIAANLEVTSSMKKQDARDGLLGRLFAYGSLVRAEGLLGQCTLPIQKELAVVIVQQLFTLAKQKTFLREAAVNLIIELVRRLPASAVEETVCTAPLFEEWLRPDLVNQSAEALLLALKLHEKLQAPTLKGCSLLPESGHLQDLFLPSHLVKIVPCLKESSSSHPRVHSVWTALLDHLLPQSTSEVPVQESAKKRKSKLGNSKVAKDVKKLEANLTNFWTVIVDGALLPSSHERKHLAMELMLQILPRLPTPESVSIVLSNIFIRCILDILSAKDTLLHKSAQRCLGALRTWAENDYGRRVAVIVALQKNSHGKFDALSKSSTVKVLTSGLTTEESVMSFVESLRELFQSSQVTNAKASKKAADLEDGEGDELMTEKEKSGDSDRIWIIEQMCAVSRQVKLELRAVRVTLYKEVIKFLTLHSLFDASKQPENGKAGNETWRGPHTPLSDNVRRIATERLRSILVDAEHWTSTQKLKNTKEGIGAVEDSLVSDADDLALFSVECCETMQKSQAARLVQPLKEEDVDTVKNLQKAVFCLSATVKTETNVEKTKRLLAMRALLSHLLLESFLEPGFSNDIAAELVICCSKAFPHITELSTIVTPVEEDEDSDSAPPVMDVLVDILLSLLPKPSAPIRAAAEQVFKVFCGDLTSAGLTDVLRIINKGSKAGRHKSIIEGEEGDSDEDDDDILEEDDDNEEGLEDDSKDGDESEEEGEDEDEEDDVEMDDSNTTKNAGVQLQNRFNSTTGVKEDRADDEELEASDSEYSDMDDEAMFRTDALLANVLKERKKVGKKATQTELAHFKFRVLSLLEYFLQKHPGSSLVLIAVQGLLKAFVNAVNQLGTAAEENESLVKRLENILQGKVVKVKKYPRGTDVDLSLVRALLKKAWKLASRSTIKRVRTLAQGCSLWTLKVILGNLPEVEGDADLLQFLASALNEYFTHKKSRLSGTFFTEIFQRHSWLGRSSFGQLIEECGNARTEFLKCEAMRLFSGVLKPITSGKGKKQVTENDDLLTTANSLEPHLATLSQVLLLTLSNPPAKAAYRLNAVHFSWSCIDTLIVLYPQTPLSTFLDTSALLAAIKAINVPSQGKLQNLITRLVDAITNDEKRIPSKNERLKDQKMKSPVNKKKKATVVETPVEMDTTETRPKKKKQIDSSVQGDEVQTKRIKKAKRPKV